MAARRLILGMNLAAQTASPPNPPNPDLTAMQNQLNALNLQLQTITVQNQILAAKVGAPVVTPVQPLAGNITQQDDKAFPEASALAYNAMRADAKLVLVYHHNELHAREDIQAEVWDRGGAVRLGSFALGFPRSIQPASEKQFPDMPPTMVPTAVKR